MAPLDVVHYFRWQSVIDILLVAFLLYQLYLWVRESRAVRAMVGLAVLGALSLTARWMGLTLAGWLFESLWSMMLLVIVIVFQPEIRRILERMNPLDVFRGQRVVLERETLAELTDAVFSLARKGTLSPFFEPGRLQQDLDREFQDSLSGEALQGRGWTWLTRHWWAKGLAVGLTAVLWTAVVGQQSSEIALTVPIEYQYI